ncbi:MAG TPA: ATP-binding protein [Thermoanaerobaculia bacterium]|nr:ATP-binding protein [Thermoanaerobaculia bacterium]HUM30123.1 ATP-binding protein [Thermoanaerobaculia bacterium]HXK68820.1 ATP-binding protein [Thermoanaerobaculia bacterium]
MREIVILSGKGGTGKTSITASFAVLAGHSVIADCDVDAADLHLVLSPDVRKRQSFTGGHEAKIRQDDCSACGTCFEYCRYGAIVRTAPDRDLFTYLVDPIACEGCGVCVEFCPEGAIEFPEVVCGEWMISETRCGPMVHARLGIAAENSGKLVSLVRKEARRIAGEREIDLILIDGPPGIGCPVIASMTGSSRVLVVTEPTVSGEHDLMRVLSLSRHFSLPVSVCVNKWDLNPAMTERIEKGARQAGASLSGRIRYDRSVTQAQLEERAVVEQAAPCAEDIRKVFDHLITQEES